MSPRDSGAGDRGGARRMLPSVSEVASELGRQVAADPAVLYKIARQVVAEELAKVKQGLESAPVDVLVKRARRLMAPDARPSPPATQPELFTPAADEKAARDLSAPFEIASTAPVPPAEIPAPPVHAVPPEAPVFELPSRAELGWDRPSAEIPMEAVGLAPFEVPAAPPAPPEPPPLPPEPPPESFLVKPASPSLIQRIAGEAPVEPEPPEPDATGENEATLSAEFKTFPRETLERLNASVPKAADVEPPASAAEAPLAADESGSTRPVEPLPRRGRGWLWAVAAVVAVAAIVSAGLWWFLSQGERMVKSEAQKVEVPPRPESPEPAEPIALPVPAPPAAPPSRETVKAAPPATSAPLARATPVPVKPSRPAAQSKPAPGAARAAVMATTDWAGKAPVFVLHFSSHKDRPSAEKEAARLAAVFYKPAHAVEVDLGERGIWYRVVVGEFPRAEEARAFREDLAARNTPGMGFVYEMRAR